MTKIATFCDGWQAISYHAQLSLSKVCHSTTYVRFSEGHPYSKTSLFCIRMICRLNATSVVKECYASS